MEQTVLFKAPGHRSNSPIIILKSVNLADESLTFGTRVSRALSAACKWVGANVPPRNILRALFCEKVSMAVAAVVICAMWWHNITIDNTIEAQKAVGTDCLYALPLGIVWAIRATLMPMPKEGGEK